ncbi:MAG: chemotaxis protein methyltransferase CheR [Puniceicoccaceae bacterium 5H]|nr:MAG: chemotaxis protein methyltransferase CheR [Puniceicoccaceae bacterium 5H]
MSRVPSISSSLTIGPLSQEEYDRFSQAIYKLARINLGPHKKELVTARLSKRLRALGLRSFSDYYEFINSSAGREELTNFVDAISTNHTFFFREVLHFEFMASTVVPDHVKDAGRRPLRVWSAACSSGEEPYSIAITLAETLPASAHESFEVVATDISTRVLAKAQQGIYPANRLQSMPPEVLKRYFLRQPQPGDDPLFQARPQLRQRLKFVHLNLFANYPWREPFDVVFLRNVMIYFDRETQSDLIQRILPWIRPGGYLITGQSESLGHNIKALKVIRPSIHQKSHG